MFGSGFVKNSGPTLSLHNFHPDPPVIWIRPSIWIREIFDTALNLHHFYPDPSDIWIPALNLHHFHPDPSDIMIRALNHYILIRIRRIYGSGLLIFIIFIYLDPSDIWIRALNHHYFYPDPPNI